MRRTALNRARSRRAFRGKENPDLRRLDRRGWRISEKDTRQEGRTTIWRYPRPGWLRPCPRNVKWFPAYAYLCDRWNGANADGSNMEIAAGEPVVVLAEDGGA
jgi:hypothetical protein